ncbi:polygalacturonase [Diabrotica virgifera virgifera]|uniref:endo-polygalacturonase n=1 Tax=Diabrotica virgifera virgifera TaxID=50390 RepID=A0ABM5KQX8_DIAVI|nr:polygalacturonase [Diabrotica virgifera virgifera]
MYFSRNYLYIFLNLTAVFVPSLTEAQEQCTIREFSQISEVIERCKNITVSNLEVPANVTLDFDLQTGSTLTFEGVTLFKNATWVGPLVRFRGSQIVVQGAKGSFLDGQGALYWDGMGGNGGVTKPYFFQIETTGGSIFRNIHLLNCPHHCVIISSTDLTITGWNIDVSAGDKGNLGHNTDGFDVIYGENIVIENSIVQNQDDCVAINRGKNMLISNLRCYGGHGISLSVGFSHRSYKHNTVHNVTFIDCVVARSENGIHVKTHNDGYLGEIKNVTYKNIEFVDILNYGVNVQQDYANGTSTGNPTNNIPITNLSLINVHGTVKGSHATGVYILCGSAGCIDWNWSEISITGAKRENSCNYVPSGYQC